MSDPYGQLPAYGEVRPADPERLPWPRVVVRALLVTLPAQLVGNFAGSIIVVASGILRDHPGFATVMVVLGGLLAGLGMGIVLKPDRGRLVPVAVVAAAVSAAVFLLLLGLAQLRLPAVSPHAPASSFLVGALIVIVAQSAVALPLWLTRLRNAH